MRFLVGLYAPLKMLVSNAVFTGKQAVDPRDCGLC